MSFRHWLPKEAFLGPAIKDTLSDPVAKWSENWFANAAAAVSKVRASEDAAAVFKGLEVGGTHATLEISGSGKRRLLEALLDTDLSEQSRNECDSHILDVLATEVAQDLVSRLDAAFAEDPDENDAGKLRLTVTIGRNELLDIVLGAHLLVPLLKARLGVARAPWQPLRERSEALRRTCVVARASLGYADVSLGEVRELCVGDVLVLDRHLNEPVELRVADNSPPIARGKLRRSGDRVSIQL